MRSISKIIIAATMFLASFAVAQTPRISFKVPNLYPEGASFNAQKNVFYVSSVKTGTIGTVDQSGNYKVFYQDKSLKSSYGMKVDVKNNRLWVCISDANYSDYSDPSTFKKMARVIGLDLNSGKKVQDIDLSNLFPGKHFANDLAFDPQGNIYVTDSFSPVIYKIDAKGKAIVFAESELFKGEDVGLNGIAFHPQGFLLVADARAGALYKVDVRDPKKITKVMVNRFFPGADGLLLDDQQNLILVQNQTNSIFKLSSMDSWQNAQVVAATSATDRFAYPTAIVQASGKLYALNAKLNELADPTKPKSKEFSLQLAEFKLVK